MLFILNVDWSCVSLRNTMHQPTVESMSNHRLRRWRRIDSTMGGCLLFAEIKSFQQLRLFVDCIPIESDLFLSGVSLHHNQ